MAHQVDLCSMYKVGISSITTSIRDNIHSDWGARIRTRINGFKVRRATIAPRPNVCADKKSGGLYCNTSHYWMTITNSGYRRDSRCVIWGYHLLFDSPTSYKVARAHFLEKRLFDAAVLHGNRAAGMETTTSRWV